MNKVRRVREVRKARMVSKGPKATKERQLRATLARKANKDCQAKMDQEVNEENKVYLVRMDGQVNLVTKAIQAIKATR